MDKQANNIITYKAKHKIDSYAHLKGNKILRHSFKNGKGKIEYSNAIQKISDNYLHFASSVYEVNFPDSVIKIGKDVLSNNNLTRFTLGCNVTSIGEGFLKSSAYLVELHVDERNQTYDSRENCNAIVETATNTLIVATKSTIRIPKSVTNIIRKAFNGKNCPDFISVDNGNPVYDSRGNCSAIIETATNKLFIATRSTRKIPKSVIDIDAKAFDRWDNYPMEISVERGNPVFDSRDNCNAIIYTETNSIIFGTPNAVIPDSVTRIEDGAFAFCDIETVHIPGNVKSIGETAFGFNCSIKKLTIDEGVEYIENEAFVCSEIEELTIPDSVIEIGNCAFYMCTELEKVILGRGLKKIGKSAFSRGGSASHSTPTYIQVESNADIPPIISDTTFFNVKKISVPGSSLEQYKDNANWSTAAISAKLCEYKMLDVLKSKKAEIQIARLKVLDKCLCSATGSTIEDLCDKCSNALVAERLIAPRSHNESIRRTIFNDFKYIRNTLKVEIEKCNGGGHQPHYRYADPNFSMFGKNKSNASGNLFDAREIGNALSVLQQFSGLPGFEQVGKVINDLQERLGLEQNGPSISFDVRQENSGSEYITPIQNAINAKHSLNVTYREQGGKKKSFVIHPYNLTQRGSCWYLICHKDDSIEKDDITTLELFRIEKLAKSKVPYIDNDFDISDYLYDVMGVHVLDDMSPVMITLQFSKGKYPFIEKNPIHGSQTYVKTQPRTITIKVQPNDDFYKAMLELGSDVEVLSPQPVRERMRELTQTVANIYK